MANPEFTIPHIEQVNGAVGLYHGMRSLAEADKTPIDQILYSVAEEHNLRHAAYESRASGAYWLMQGEVRQLYKSMYKPQQPLRQSDSDDYNRSMVISALACERSVPEVDGKIASIELVRPSRLHRWFLMAKLAGEAALQLTDERQKLIRALTPQDQSVTRGVSNRWSPAICLSVIHQEIYAKNALKRMEDNLVGHNIKLSGVGFDVVMHFSNKTAEKAYRIEKRRRGLELKDSN